MLVKRAQTRIETVKLAALSNTDEEAYVTLFRKCHATWAALQEFLQDLNAELEEPKELPIEY